MARLIATATPSVEEDRLLTASEAAEKLGVSKDWLYRHAAKLAFTVRPTRGTVRFSLRGLQHYLKRRTPPSV